MPVFTKSSDASHKIQLESHLIYAIWSHKQAHAGQVAELEVRTSFVGNGAQIKITCYTDNGKKLDKIDGTVYNNRFDGSIVIPDKVKSDDMIYFEAELPKHKLKGESNTIPVRPAIKVSNFQWDRQEVKREETVTLTCQFESGVTDDDDARVIIYEHNPNSCDFPVVSIPTKIKDNKVEMQWEFNYQDPTKEIPTDSEMQKYQKKYVNPEFFFVVVVDGVRMGIKQESGLMKFKDWVEILLVDSKDRPIADHDFTVTFADGTQGSGTTDGFGKATIKNCCAGPYTVKARGIESLQTVDCNNSEI